MKKIKFPRFSSDEKLRIALNRSEPVYHHNCREHLDKGRLCLAWDGDSDPVGQFICLGYLTTVHERKGDGSTFRIQTDTCELDYKRCAVIDRWSCPEVVFKHEDGQFASGHLIGFTGEDGEFAVVINCADAEFLVPLCDVAYAEDVVLGLEEENG